MHDYNTHYKKELFLLVKRNAINKWGIEKGI